MGVGEKKKGHKIRIEWFGKTIWIRSTLLVEKMETFLVPYAAIDQTEKRMKRSQ